MILVIAGNALQPFWRLVRFASEIARVSGERVIFQNGSVEYGDCGGIEFVGTLGRQEFEKAIASSEFAVTHCGAGTLRTLLALRKRAIGVPRLKRYGEHVNDHQFEIARQFHSMRHTFLPDTWAEQDLNAIEVLGSLKAFPFNFETQAQDSLNDEVSRLLRKYLS